MISLELKIRYKDGRTAETVLKALEPDNTGHVVSRIKGNEITFAIKADAAGTLRRLSHCL